LTLIMEYLEKPQVARYGLRVIKGDSSNYNAQLVTRNTTKFQFLTTHDSIMPAFQFSPDNLLPPCPPGNDPADEHSLDFRCSFYDL